MTSRIIQRVVAGVMASTIGTTVYLVACDGNPQNCSKGDALNDAIKKAEELCKKIKEESGSPGLVAGVSVDGTNVLNIGLGYADIENNLMCNSTSVMRIASISKSLTMVGVAKLLQENKLSLDKPIQEYVSQYPEKYWEGEKTDITMRQLVSHLSGIRHYSKKPVVLPKTNNEPNGTAEEKVSQEFNKEEYYIRDYYNHVRDSLLLFQDDELFFKPGSSFLYTTHGWTLISAVVEEVATKPFPKYMKSIFHELGLRNTYLDENKPIIYNRAKYYVRNEKGKLENAPYVDNSYKWAGGGFLSTANDLIKFGNAMLYSYQNSNGIINKEAVEMMWTPVENSLMPWDVDGSYGMGWGVVKEQSNFPHCNSRQFYVSHTGGAIGASSVLLIMPQKETCVGSGEVRGVVVAIIVNMQSVGLNKTALEIAQLFEGITV